MGAMDKFISYMQLKGKMGEYEYEDEDDYYDDEDEEYENKRPSVVKRPNIVKEEPEEIDRMVKKPQNNKITQMRQVSSKRIASNNGMEVCIIKPTTMEDSREVTDTLLANRSVILNLEGLDLDLAQRIVDFSYGSIYALGGHMEKISNFIFIITPSSVDITGDFLDIFGGTMDSPISGLN